MAIVPIVISTAKPALGALGRFVDALRSPIRIRLYTLTAIATVGVTIAVQLAGAGTQNATRQLAEQAFQADTTAVAASVSARIDVAYASLAGADTLVTHGHDVTTLCEIIGDGQQLSYERLFAFRSTGELLCTTIPNAIDQPDVIQQRAYFQRALTTGADQVGGPLIGSFSGSPALAFAHRIRDRSNTVSVIVGASEAGGIIQPALTREHSDRVIVIGRDGGQFELGPSGRPSPPSAVSHAVEQAQATGNVCAVMTEGGTAWTCSPAGRSGVMILAGHPGSEIFSAVTAIAERQRYRTIGVVVIAVLATLATDVLFLQRIRLAYRDTGLPSLRAGEAASHDEVDVLRDWVGSVEGTLGGLRDEVRMHESRRRDSERDLLTLIAEAVEARYPFLRDHGDRVGRYARQIGARLGFSVEDLDLLEFAGRIHDLGKITITDAVYLKQGRLEPIETAQMQLHAARGGEMCSRMRTVPSAVADAVRHHHERWDGTGYPDSLAGTAIPLWSRVIAVADAYDAMTEERPYRPLARTHGEAIAILREGAGSQWDATAVRAFLEVVESGDVPPKPISVAPGTAL
jgi:HD-GYP domain-containing protein (c-di-GMP phosphodiesterase class II)